jgi:DNA-binding transcriptional LysR family regulator
MSELNEIRAFLAVVEAGGFGRAARRLNIAKSIVSRRIARLEAHLGARLLSRTTRGIYPTEAGLEFKERAEHILDELEEARAAIAQRSGGVVGRVRISVPLSFGVLHIAPILGELALRYPKLNIEAEFSDRIVDLIGEHFDLAIRIGRLKDSSLVARRIAPVRAVVVASAAYLAEHGTPATPEDIARHECLIYSGATSDWLFRSGKRWLAVRPQGRLKSDSGEAILQWAIAGLGIAALPTFVASEAIGRGTIQPLLLDYPMPEFGVYAVRPPGPRVPAKVRVLIDAMVERFAGEPYWDPCQMAAIAREEGAGPAMELANARDRQHMAGHSR